jgi:hypothetical protein
MLPILATKSMEFESPAKALEYVDQRVLQRFTVDVSDLSLNEAGKLRHTGSAPLPQLQDLPLTDVALGHIDSFAGISPVYAANIESDLHAVSINKQLRREVSAVTVVVEYERVSERSHVVAVLRGGRIGISDAVLLRRIESRNLGALVCFDGGEMTVNFGDEHHVEVLPNDHFRVIGHLRNAHWGVARAATQPVLEVSAFLLRLICTNGAYARRALAEGRIMAWASSRELDALLDTHLDRVLSFQNSFLEIAVARMSAEIPDEPDREVYQRMILRSLGEKTAAALMAESEPVSQYDWFNVLTAAANRPRSQERRRRLQIEGGAILDRYLPAH